MLRNETIWPDERRLAILEALLDVVALAVAVIAVHGSHSTVGPWTPSWRLEHCPVGSLALWQQAVVIDLDEMVYLDVCIFRDGTFESR